MKIQTLLPIAAILAVSLFSFCKNDPPASKVETTEVQAAPTEPAATIVQTPVTIGDQALNNPVAQPPAGATNTVVPPKTNTVVPPKTTTEPAQNATGVWHYTCPDGHPGGGGSVAPCAKCGKPLAHNAAYHGTPNPAATTTAPGQTTATTPKPEPAQNAAGVWHYTCPDGHAGGGGGAAPCKTCSKMLVHNQAYHNK